MDIAVLTQAVVEALTPFLSQLPGRVAGKLADSAATELGKKAFDKAASLWQRLARSDENGSLAQEVSAITASSERASIGALADLIRKMIDRDRALADDLRALVFQDQSSRSVSVEGTRNVAVGSSADRSIIVTGSLKR